MDQKEDVTYESVVCVTCGAWNDVYESDLTQLLESGNVADMPICGHCGFVLPLPTEWLRKL